MGRLYLISVHWNLSKNSALRNHLLFCLAGHLYTAILADTTTTVNLGTLSKDHTGTTMPTGTKWYPIREPLPYPVAHTYPVAHILKSTTPKGES